jgi:predicted RNase H-like HicB family nuclease
MKKEYKASVSLGVQFVKEGNAFVAYCPALDISTQGETLAEAQKMFGELVRVYIDELIDMGTLDEVLLSCGWKNQKNRWIPPQIDFISEEQRSVNIPCSI